MIRHRWNLTPGRAAALQQKLRGRVQSVRLKRPIRTIAGADCAALGADTIVAAAVLCDARTLRLIAAAADVRPCRFPYVPGLLSFREAPAVIAAVGKLPLRPDLLMCDGQGVAHPRRLGLASHVGLWVDAPTIGVAKSRLCGQHRPLGVRRGCRVRLTDGADVIGAVVRTRAGVKPLYVSVGHRITLPEAAGWVLRSARQYRLPEPTRQAHMLVGAVVAFLAAERPVAIRQAPSARCRAGSPGPECLAGASSGSYNRKRLRASGFGLRARHWGRLFFPKPEA